MHITRAKHPINNQYTMHNQTLDTFDTARYVNCVDISDNKRIKRNVRTKNPIVREAGYKTLLRPHVEYASTVWSPHTDQGIKKVEMVQRKAIRWTMNNFSSYTSVTDMQTNCA